MRIYKVKVVPGDPKFASPGNPLYDVCAESAAEAKVLAIAMAPKMTLKDGVEIPNVAEVVDVEPDCCPTCMGLGVVPEGRGLEPGLARKFRERFRRTTMSMPQRFTCACGRIYEVGAEQNVEGDRVVSGLYARLVDESAATWHVVPDSSGVPVQLGPGRLRLDIMADLETDLRSVPEWAALKAALHSLWTKNVGTPGYDKREWQHLDNMIVAFARLMTQGPRCR